MFTPIVRHWRRGDLDRLYVTTASGRQLGWFDLVDETLYTATESLRPMLWRAVTDFRLARKPEVPAARDLATHRAGAWELEQAFRCVDESPLFYSASTVCNERDERSEWETAAEGAVVVAEAVAAMPGGWTALHSVPSGRHAERLDHVLIGSAGVVVVLSEHVPAGEVVAAGDHVDFDGTRQKIVGHLGRLVDHVLTRVPVNTPVRVVVAVHGATVNRRRALTDDRVQVLAAAELGAYVTTLPTPLDRSASEALFASLRRRGTWYPYGKHGSSRAADPAFALAGLQLLDGLPRLVATPASPGRPQDVVVEVPPSAAAVEAVVADPPPARHRRFNVALTRPTAAA